jgi:hypothetical protein
MTSSPEVDTFFQRYYLWFAFVMAFAFGSIRAFKGADLGFELYPSAESISKSAFVAMLFSGVPSGLLSLICSRILLLKADLPSWLLLLALILISLIAAPLLVYSFIYPYLVIVIRNSNLLT